MDFDISKWFDVLKANAWQYACLSLSCFALLWFDAREWLPVAFEGTVKQLVQIAGFAFAALWLASVGSAVSKIVMLPWDTIRRWRSLRNHAEEFRAYIPHMTPESRRVIAQLLHENHKDFTADADGGHAATLIGRRFIVRCLTHGQVFDVSDVPFKIPDHIWTVAMENKAEFSYTPDRDGADAWRVHWMAR